MSRSLRIASLAIAAVIVTACESSHDEAPPLVDETGFLKGSLIRYTAIGTLGDMSLSVTVIGLPGAISEVGGELTIATTAEPTPSPGAVAADGSFVASAGAALDDTVTLRYALVGREQRLELVLDDALDGLPTPAVAPGSNGSTGSLSVVVGSDNTVSIDLDQIVERTTDVIVFNETNGAALRASPGQRTVSLSGQRGDRICVFALDQAGASPTLCTTAR